MRALLTALIGAALLLALAAAPVVASSYTYSCDAGANNEHEYLTKDPSGSEFIYGRAQVDYLRDVDTCGAGGSSFVLPVNLDGGMLAQFGYGRIGNGSLLWLWTANVHSSPLGVLSEFPASFSPTVGHRYIFHIAYRWEEGTWKFTVQDVDTGGSASAYDYTTTYVSSDFMWSGFEVWDDGDQMGGAGNNVYITNIGYTLDGGSGTSYFGSADDALYKLFGDEKWYWSTYADTTSGRAWVRSNTALH